MGGARRGRRCRQPTGDNARIPMDTGRALECRLVLGALAAPAFERFDVIPRRLARLEMDDPSDGLIEERIRPGGFRWEGHSFRSCAARAAEIPLRGREAFIPYK